MDDQHHARFELPPPDAVEIATKAVEIFRLWECDGVPHARVHDQLGENPFGAGIALGDLVRMLARATDLHPNIESHRAMQELKSGIFQRLLPQPEEIPPDFPQLLTYSRMVKIYHAESDRAAAVLAGSAMEAYLGECLQYFLVDHPSVKKLFENVGPLATFAGRANMAFALGLLTEDMHSDLRYIRRVRNHFAHHPAETSFDVSPVREWCKNFKLTHALPDRTPREHYLFAIGATVGQLNNFMLSVARRRVPSLGGV